MDFSLREWLIVIGVIIIVAILIDGYRRYRKPQLGSSYDDDYVDPDEAKKEAIIRHELPNGGARPVAPRAASADPVQSAFENARMTARGPLTEMPHKVDAGPQMDRTDKFELDELASLVPERDKSAAAASAEQDYADVLYEGYAQQELEATLEDELEPVQDFERDYSNVDLAQSDITAIEEPVEEDEEEAEIEEVIVINVFAPKDSAFAGMELLQLVLNCGMRYGEMDIFHRHEDGFDKGKIQFSMANAIEPGTFDLDTMGESECPGVSFFMGLPGPKNSMKAFDFMLETAQALVRNLGGELRDERRAPMSEQTIAHCRQRIRDFERRQLAKKKRPS
ncbi:cell division protein ZipA [Marinomonas ostreistagni]|uniref:cell division protein ZipA n=1 Tax=Marinomonas ostreistagni TaxID=359209 RepID=UPI00195261B6|nr:cell division protein ZipA [Marinomonas ostreistagni]MBM6551284.1 cell division protein ZipA [Marinomonas ostreistagni]